MGIIPDLVQGLNTANSFNRGDGSSPPRIPLILTCTNWMNKGIPAIALKLNPHSVSFKQGKRVTRRNTQGGTVYMHWSDENGQNNDILEISFRGKTGNIDLRGNPNNVPGAIGSALGSVADFLGGANGKSEPGVPTNSGAAKLYTWSRLYALTREPMYDTTTGLASTSVITYQSPLFPRPINFGGFFNNVLDFAEAAEKPYLVEWSFSFIVQRTNPNLNTLSTGLALLLSSANSLKKGMQEAMNKSIELQQADASAAKANFNNG